MVSYESLNCALDLTGVNFLQSHLLDTFEDTFNEAVQQIVQYGGVIVGEDAE